MKLGTGWEYVEDDGEDFDGVQGKSARRSSSRSRRGSFATDSRPKSHHKNVDVYANNNQLSHASSINSSSSEDSVNKGSFHQQTEKS